MIRLLVAIIFTSLIISASAVVLFAAPTMATGGAGIVEASAGRYLPTIGGDEALLKKLQESAATVSDYRKEMPKTSVSERQASIAVKAEPGDGLVRLSWKMPHLPAAALEQQPRFVILYGTESERLTSSHAVGTFQESVLRGLKNFQPYYIQIVALDREQKPLVRSQELRSIPLPTDLLGSTLERNFARQTSTLQDQIEPEQLQRELKQFGYDFFKNTAQLSQGLDLLPAGDDYAVGPGDVLKLSLWGAVNAQYDLTVDRNGEVLIPKVGSVQVWGLKLGQAKEAIYSAIGRYFRNYEMNLTMGPLRTVQVYVVGEVEAPGSYPVSSMATVINALAAAGGPTRNGSLRTVRITRGKKAVETVDLYDMLLTGDRSKDMRLQNGDTLFVPVIGPVVGVAGEVKRPAIYELSGATNLAQLLQMAGGVTASGDTGRIQLERLAENKQRVVQDVLAPTGKLAATLSSVRLQDRDMVKVFPVLTATHQLVSLKGNVQRPGEYQFKPGMHLTDLIPSTQALLPETYLDSVEITRLVPPDYRKELLTANLRAALAGSILDNIQLQEQDSVKVFSLWEMKEKPKVALNGAVVNPGVYQFYPGMSVRDLVTAGGSPKRNAYLELAELSRIQIAGDKATTKRISLNLAKALAGEPQQNLPLQPDDVLIVRSVADWQDATDKFITLKGEVRFPGVYSVVRGEKLSSVIERAGGYTSKAYLFGAKFTRRSVQEQQQKRMGEIIQRAERDVAQKQATLAQVAASKEELEVTKATLEGVQRSLDQMRRLRAEGRVVLRLAVLDELKQSSYDLELEGGDELEIPQRPGVVHVLGQVYNPTSFVYLAESASVESYLNKAGGPTREAAKDEIYVIRADGSVFSRQQSSFGIHWSEDSKSWSLGSFMASQLMPGDTVVVPQQIEKTAWMRDIKDITQILANVAMTAGSVYLWFK